MEIEYNEKKVNITSKNIWNYDGVEEYKIKELNKELFCKIQEEVIFYIDNKEKVDAENKKKEQKEKLQNHLTAHEQFKTSFNKDFGEQTKNYSVTFYPPQLGACSYEVKRIDINGFKVYFDNQVYNGRGCYSSPTSKCWVLYTRDYKIIRYASLSSAVTKCLEKIDECRTQKVRKTKMKKYAEDNGFEFSKDYHDRQSYRNKYADSYYIYSMKKGNIFATLYHNKELNIIEAKFKISVTKELISVEDIKKIAKEVE